MTQAVLQRAFEPGTTGWTVDDLADPEILDRWSEGRYELVEGVLAKMPPQGFDGIYPLSRLRRQIEDYLTAIGQAGEFHNESDLLLDIARIARPDMVFLTEQQFHDQKRISEERGRVVGMYNPIYVMPALVVESLSRGHERHDRLTKRSWYAEARIPHYWLLSAPDRSLVCLVLDGREYVEKVSGRDSDVITTPTFPGLKIELAKLW
jgi:Uma2 family endonuclease